MRDAPSGRRKENQKQAYGVEVSSEEISEYTISSGTRDRVEDERRRSVGKEERKQKE